MALNLNPERTDRAEDKLLKQQFSAVADHLDDDYYVWRFVPADFCADPNFPGAIFGSSANSQAAAIRLADAATQQVMVTRRVPRLWLSGKFLIEIDYDSNVGSTNNFNVGVKLSSVAKTGNLNTPTSLLSVSVNWPGPAAAFGLKQYSVYSTTSLAGDAHLITLSISRDGAADANNNRLDIIAATVTFIPASREAHV